MQRPGGGQGITTGDGELAPDLARAAAGIGVDGFFMETHLNPAEALSDKANLVPFAKMPGVWQQLCALNRIAREG